MKYEVVGYIVTNEHGSRYFMWTRQFHEAMYTMKDAIPLYQLVST